MDRQLGILARALPALVALAIVMFTGGCAGGTLPAGQVPRTEESQTGAAPVLASTPEPTHTAYPTRTPCPTPTAVPPTATPTATSTATSTPTVPPPTAAPTATPRPTRVLVRPPTGLVPAEPADPVPPSDVRRTTVLVKNGTDSDALVILLNVSTGGKRAAYIWAGESYEIDLGGSEGTYEIYFSKGLDWDDEVHGFTRDVVYQKFEDRLTCAGYGEDVSYEITLYGVVGGNAATDYVSPGEFPHP